MNPASEFMSAPRPPARALMKVSEVARACAVSEMTVRRAIEDGALRTLKFRGRLRIDPRELARYLGCGAPA